MKMRIFDRILLTLYTLFGIFLSVILFGIALNIIDYQVLLSKLSSGIHGWDAFILGIIAVILFLVSIRLLIAGYTRRKSVSALLMNTELGIIRVSVNTLDTLTQKAVRSFQEVRDIKSLVLTEPDGIRVQLKVSILPDVEMPELTRNIQQKVKEYIESLAGIAVKEVQVYIENLVVAKQARVD
ncbi:MAG: alkaline shock response membrane anchor protein AmaP [Clostridiales bacterium]|jgi:uncharacterized alkaline shock family protein YloU|nr:alkaline shock response membrane anchor protein AmaP [Clostridiales bacterium]